jgi:hypothetical protein
VAPGVVLGVVLRSDALFELRSNVTSFVKEIEDYLLANFSDSDLFDDLKEPIATHSAGGPTHTDDSKLENVFRGALERISVLCGGMGRAYLNLIHRYSAGEIGFVESFDVLAHATEIFRPRDVVRGQARPGSG